MFGYLRFLLATLVLLSHVGVTYKGLNPGVFAVVGFYILAGSVVSFLITDIYQTTPKNLLPFYKDRAIRILPLYFIVVIATLIFLILTNYAQAQLDPLKLIYNILIIPLNYFMFLNANILQDPAWPLIPPAWSLGTELQVYMLLPLVLFYRAIYAIALIGSIAIYSLANFGILHPDYYGYRLPVGVFFMFLLGVMVHKKQYYQLIAVYLFTLATFIFFETNSLYQGGYTKETLLAILIITPVIYILANLKFKLPYNKLLGQLSYGIFLTHFLAIWVLKHYNFYTNHSEYKVFLLSLLLSYAGLLLERRIHAFFNKK